MKKDSRKKHRTGNPLRYLFAALLIVAVVSAVGLFGVRELVNRLSGVSYGYYSYSPSPEDPAAEDAYHRKVIVYFTSEDRRLYPQEFKIPRGMSHFDTIQYLLKELIDGPTAGYLLSPFPDEADYTDIVRGVYLKGQTIVVDFHLGFRDLFNGGTGDELLALFAVSNTLLANLEHYTGLQVLMDGRPIESLPGGLDLTYPLKINYPLISSQK